MCRAWERHDYLGFKFRVWCAGYGSGKARGLPGGMKVVDLLMTKVEAIPTVTDRNPDVECEFFHTRQVRQTAAPVLLQPV